MDHSTALIFIGLIAIVALILAAVSLGTNISDSRLSSNVALLNVDQAFTEEHGFAETRIYPVSIAAGTGLTSNDVTEVFLLWDLRQNQSTTVTLTQNTTLAIPTGGRSGFLYYLQVEAPIGIGLYLKDPSFNSSLPVTYGNSLIQMSQNPGNDGPLFYFVITESESLPAGLAPTTHLMTEKVYGSITYVPASGDLEVWFDQGSNGYNTMPTGIVSVRKDDFFLSAGMVFGAIGNYVSNPTVSFDGFFGQGVNTTIFLVGKRFALTDCTVFSVVGTSGFVIIIGSGDVTVFDVSNGYTFNVTFVAGQPFVFAVQMSQQTLKLFFNNTLNSKTFDGPFVNKSSATGVFKLGDAFEGSIAECLVYDRALLDQEVFAVCAQLTKSYQLPVV